MGGNLMSSAYRHPSRSVRSASGGSGKNVALRTATFSSMPSSRFPSRFLNGGMYDDRGELFLAHFATFHSPSIDSEAVSTRSLCAVLRALSINFAFRFLARLYCSHASSVRARFALLLNRLASICASLHCLVKPATDLGLGLLRGVDRSIAVLMDCTMAFARSSISCGSVADSATGISFSNDALNVWMFVSLHRLLGGINCCLM